MVLEHTRGIKHKRRAGRRPAFYNKEIRSVHSETTSGILNDIEAVGKVVKEKGRVFIVDAMSSFGGVDIPVKDWGIDFIISSVNKCIQGVPGFSFIIARRDLLEASASLNRIQKIRHISTSSSRKAKT